MVQSCCEDKFEFDPCCQRNDLIRRVKSKNVRVYEAGEQHNFQCSVGDIWGKAASGELHEQVWKKLELSVDPSGFFSEGFLWCCEECHLKSHFRKAVGYLQGRWRKLCVISITGTGKDIRSDQHTIWAQKFCLYWERERAKNWSLGSSSIEAVRMKQTIYVHTRILSLWILWILKPGLKTNKKRGVIYKTFHIHRQRRAHYAMLFFFLWNAAYYHFKMCLYRR